MKVHEIIKICGKIINIGHLLKFNGVGSHFWYHKKQRFAQYEDIQKNNVCRTQDNFKIIFLMLTY